MAYLVLGREGSYFVKEQGRYTEEVIINMLEFLVDYYGTPKSQKVEKLGFTVVN